MNPFALFICLGVTLTGVASAVEPKIIYEEDPTLLTSVIEVVVQTGAEDDPPGKNGLSNLMGELILRGTKKRDRAKFQSAVERMGASVYVRVTHDSIYFIGRVIKENTQALIELMSEALLKPAFSKREFESLKAENLAEIANIKNNNGRLSGLAVRKVLMNGTILEKPLEGSLSTVKAITLNDVIRHYNDRFNRANILFAVASPVPEAELKKPLMDLWLQLPDGTKRVRKSLAPQTPRNPTLVVVHKPKTSTGAIMFGQAGIFANDPDLYPLNAGNYSFGGEALICRLFRVIRSELGWTYMIHSTYTAAGHLSRQQGFYVISSTPSVEFTAKTIFKIQSMWQDYLQKGLTKDELSLAKESIINSYPFEFENAEKRLWKRLYSYLYDEPLLNPEDFAKVYKAIDNDRLRKALTDRHAKQGWVISVVADKDVIEKQLAEEQKDVPEEKRLKISAVMTPEDLVR